MMHLIVLKVRLTHFLRSFKYITNESTTVNRSITIEGSAEVYDPAEYNTSETNLATDKSPGIYISNPFSDILNIEKTRAQRRNGGGLVYKNSRSTFVWALLLAAVA